MRQDALVVNDTRSGRASYDTRDAARAKSVAISLQLTTMSCHVTDSIVLCAFLVIVGDSFMQSLEAFVTP